MTQEDIMIEVFRTEGEVFRTIQRRMVMSSIQWDWVDPLSGILYTLDIPYHYEPADKSVGIMTSWPEFDHVTSTPPLPQQVINQILNEHGDEIAELIVE